MHLKKAKNKNILERILYFMMLMKYFLYVLKENKDIISKKYDDLKLDTIILPFGLKFIKKNVNKEKEETINNETTQLQIDDIENKNET